MRNCISGVFTFTVSLFAMCANGQKRDTIPKNIWHTADYSSCGHNFIFTTAMNMNKYNSYEISFGRSYSSEYNAFIWESFSQAGIGMEVLSNKNNYIYAPKVSCELDLFKILCLSRLNLLYFLNPSGQGSLKYRHEIGLTWRGYVNVNYAYTFNLTNRDFYKLGRGINLQVNIPLGKRRQDRQ